MRPEQPELERGQRCAVFIRVELGVVFYLIPLSHVSIPKNQNGTMAKDALFTGKLYQRRVRALDKKRLRVGWPGCNRTLIGQHDLAVANG